MLRVVRLEITFLLSFSMGFICTSSFRCYYLMEHFYVHRYKICKYCQHTVDEK